MIAARATEDGGREGGRVELVVARAVALGSEATRAAVEYGGRKGTA